MIKRAWSLFLTLIIVLVSGCTPLHHHSSALVKKPVSVSGLKEQTRLLPSFNRVVATGQIDVNLHTGYAKPIVILRGDPRDLQHVATQVKNNVLVLGLPKGYPKFGKVSADVRTKSLHSIDYKGIGLLKGLALNANPLDVTVSNPMRTELGGTINLRNLVVKGPGFVSISGIKSSNLQIAITGKARVQLAGVAGISCIKLKDGSLFALYWVQSDVLTVRGKGLATIQLAGIANRLDLELWGNARFNGRYLRASRTFVKTHDHSIAEISSVDRQHTLASDASDIRFYNIPVLKTDFMAFNGAVLDMRDWDMPYMQEYDQYNK